MADTLKRLTGPSALTTSAATVYTVPGATTTSIIGIHVANTSGAAATFTLSVGADAAGTRYFSGFTVAAGDAFDWAGTLVVTAAEIVQASASAATSLTLTITGVETS